MTEYTRVELKGRRVRSKVHQYIAVLTRPQDYGESRVLEAERAFKIERMSVMVFQFVIEELERLAQDGVYREEFASMRPDMWLPSGSPYALVSLVQVEG